MKTGILSILIGLTALAMPTPVAFAQSAKTAPILRVTVVERTVKAVNYEYRAGPTRIDFRGTVLLPKAKGEATVESRQGRTEIDAKFEGLSTPQRFSNEYLTYVLWAITPEGRSRNIGELISDSSNKAKLHVTTDLQSFALIVTAEPYSAVRQPSDIVVLENEVRPDTAGTVKPVEAKYELLPRGEYTWQVPGNLDRATVSSPKVSMHAYEAVLELYQAQNAVGIADQVKAERYAPDTMARAKQLLAEARELHDHKADYRRVVQSAREAAETAEDARLIAQGREQVEQLQTANRLLSKTRDELSDTQQKAQRALEEEQAAKAKADAARARSQAALTASKQAESDAIAARERASEAQSEARESQAIAVQDQRKLAVAHKRELRMRLLDDLQASLPTLDTGRGLVSTVPDGGFRDADLRGRYSDQVARIAAILSVHPKLHVSVEGYSADAAKQPLSRERADAVRRVLIANGVAAHAVSATGLGDSRPLGSNANPRWRMANSRVEIVIAGESIGDLPLWERPSTLTSSAQGWSARPAE